MVIIILVGAITCWTKGRRCPNCKRSTEVVEENEMYGEAEYAQYDQDNYDTRVTDENYYYEESHYEEEGDYAHYN